MGRPAITGIGQWPRTSRRAPLRVLLVIDELDIGGTEQQIVELVRSLPRTRYTPIVCCFRYGRKAAEIEQLGTRVVHLSKRGRADLGLVGRLVQLMRSERIDVVQTFLIGANLWGRLAALIARVPVVIASERNVDVWEEPLKRGLGRLLLAFGTDRIVANAEAVRSYLIDRGAAPRRVVTIRNGVDMDRFAGALDVATLRRSLGLAADDQVAAVVARLEPQKGHAVVLEAAAQLRDRFPRLRYLFVGGGSAESAIRAEVARRGLEDRVVFTGFRTDSADLIRAADFSILASTKEGLSNTLLESLAAGRPVIASRVGGNAEVVSSDVGLLIPPRDPAALARAIAQLADDPTSAARMGEHGRERAAQEFSVPRMAAETAALYEELGRARRLSATLECNAPS
ncbi:MAG TPA: glycosyltransferase [Candidatus Nitrosopolaris sp.]|nr:glycosyltransferase [Candidatus Nitrosopolaris sp.]